MFVHPSTTPCASDLVVTQTNSDGHLHIFRRGISSKFCRLRQIDLPTTRVLALRILILYTSMRTNLIQGELCPSSPQKCNCRQPSQTLVLFLWFLNTKKRWLLNSLRDSVVFNIHLDNTCIVRIQHQVVSFCYAVLQLPVRQVMWWTGALVTINKLFS